MRLQPQVYFGANGLFAPGIAAAREGGLTTIGFTGAGGLAMQPQCDLLLVAPSDHTPIIQQIHITAAHAICGLVERRLFAPGTKAER